MPTQDDLNSEVAPMNGLGNISAEESCSLVDDHEERTEGIMSNCNFCAKKLTPVEIWQLQQDIKKNGFPTGNE